MTSVTEEIFNFVKSKVFLLAVRKMQAPGQKDTIYTYMNGIVEAYFLRSYPQGKLWMVGDDLIMTCPTHTELGQISYYNIFGEMLGEDPRKKKTKPQKELV